MSIPYTFRTNLPKEVMAFPDLPFDKDLPSFIRHEDVLAYLETYANMFDLNKFIKVSGSKIVILNSIFDLERSENITDSCFVKCTHHSWLKALFD